MLAQVCIWRFVLGIGIGGDYPLSASIASEYASTKWRGAFVGSVFAAQARPEPCRRSRRLPARAPVPHTAVHLSAFGMACTCHIPCVRVKAADLR
jgi:hypothetical protein